MDLHIDNIVPPPDNEVHVWCTKLNRLARPLEALRQVLSEDELQRAAKFHFRRDCDRFVAARGLLRMLLQCYTGVDAAALRFCYNEFGKPALTSGRNDVRFNISHSHDAAALFAIAKGSNVGVDIERIRPRFANEQIAEQFFSESEVRALRALPAELQPEGFFNCWTRKAAYIKARGDGLSLPLRDFDVSLKPGEPARLLRHAQSPELGRWTLQALSVPAGYVAAIAVENKGRIVRWQMLEP
jgi:4'-phosphopantetheinyl transferase